MKAFNAEWEKACPPNRRKLERTELDIYGDVEAMKRTRRSSSGVIVMISTLSLLFIFRRLMKRLLEEQEECAEEVVDEEEWSDEGMSASRCNE